MTQPETRSASKPSRKQLRTRMGGDVPVAGSESAGGETRTPLATALSTAPPTVPPLPLPMALAIVAGGRRCWASRIVTRSPSMNGSSARGVRPPSERSSSSSSVRHTPRTLPPPTAIEKPSSRATSLGGTLEPLRPVPPARSVGRSKRSSSTSLSLMAHTPSPSASSSASKLIGRGAGCSSTASEGELSPPAACAVTVNHCEVAAPPSTPAMQLLNAGPRYTTMPPLGAPSGPCASLLLTATVGRCSYRVSVNAEMGEPCATGVRHASVRAQSALRLPPAWRYGGSGRPGAQQKASQLHTSPSHPLNRRSVESKKTAPVSAALHAPGSGRTANGVPR